MAVAPIRRILKKNPGQRGFVLAADRVGPALDKDLAELAAVIKAYLVAQAEQGGSHKFRKDKSGLVGQTDVTFTTDGIKIELPQYAQYIDSGSKPGAKKVPIKYLIAWVKRYRVGGRARPSGKFKKNLSVNEIAYSIQTSIWKYGTKARPFLTATVKYAEEMLGQVIDQYLIPEIITTIQFALTK